MEAAQNGAMAGGMGLLSGGFARDSSGLNGGPVKGLGLLVLAADSGLQALAAHNGIKTGKIWPEDGKSTLTNAVSTVGGLLWGSGVWTDNHVMQTLGPGLKAAASLTSAVRRYSQGEEGWGRDVAGVIEGAAFSYAGPDGNPYARTVAFGGLALGFALGAKKDLGYLGHAGGALLWGAGALTQINALEAAGSGVVAVSEVARFLYRMYGDHVQSSPGAAPERPGYELIPQRSSAVTPGSESAVGARLPVNPVATGSLSVASATSGQVPDLTSGGSLPGTLLEEPSRAALRYSPYTLDNPGPPRRASDAGPDVPTWPGTALARPAPDRRHSR